MDALALFVSISTTGAGLLSDMQTVQADTINNFKSEEPDGS
jgi:hypothetical protein